MSMATLLMLALIAAGQIRDPVVQLRGTGTIAGTAMSDESEPRPVRRVRVTCTGAEFAAAAITDDAGRFVFAGLKPGRYTIQGTKNAWVPSAYGATRPLRPGSAIPIAAGQRVAIVLRMLRGSVITGVLLDHDNQPAANTTVSVLRYAMENGVRHLSSTGASTTDDRGVYRVYGLAPGDYFVGAAPHLPDPNSPGSELRLLDARTRAERTVAFAPTYFPGTPLATQASVVSVGPAQERDGIDFTLQLVTTARVDGTVTSIDGLPPPPGTPVSLVSNAETTFPGIGFGAGRFVGIGPDGAFSFVDVGPGAYTVVVRSGMPPAWATTDIAVDGENVTGLSLALQPAMTVTGQVRIDATRLKPPGNLKAAQISLQPAAIETSVTLPPSVTVIDDQGHFEITGVVPGRYRLIAALSNLGRPGEWYVRSAIVNGQDTLDVPVAIAPGQSVRDAVVILSDRPAQLSGVVHDAAGGASNEFSVILFPADQSLWLPQSRRIHGVRPSADGAYAFRPLPPGDYLLAAIGDVEPGEWFDPAFLQRLVATAMRITIADGEQKVQDIRLGAGGSAQHAERSARRGSAQRHFTRRGAVPRLSEKVPTSSF